MGRSGLGPCQLRPEANCAPPATYLFFATLAITSPKFASLQSPFSTGNNRSVTRVEYVPARSVAAGGDCPEETTCDVP